MNKDKVLDNLMNIREWAGVVDHPATENEKDRYMHGIINLASETIKEVNSKPRMPKVFDDWYIQYGTIEDFMFSFVDSWKGNELESITQDFFAWLYDKELMINTEKLSRCIEAIQSGDYEVKE